ncbi:hypothetical protein M9Y10_032227 [Tritrichomonas musculus]|uniref:Uncharacterized protein n=1 Tax=Tritrichomonas musculus TaxID=1915356 RepID=A0ABR2GZC9_9EUKA
MNLSFREWPFLSLNQNIPKTKLRAPSLSAIEVDYLKKNMPSYLIPKMSSAHLMSQQSDEIKTEDLYFNKNQFKYNLSSWGRCGLFACTNESCLSIFSNDEKGNLSPMFMFSPFDTLVIGRLCKQPPKTAFITAIAWSDGHLEPSIPKSLLAVASEKGYLGVYDFESKKRVCSFLFEEPIVSILWCSFKQNRFYAGSRKGHFYICEVNNSKTINILRVIDFSFKLPNTFETVYKSIDFITQDDVNGYTVGVASKDQPFGFITNINDTEKVDIHIYQNFYIKGDNKENNDQINFFEFYPNSQDFVTILTSSSSFVLSISKGTLVPFIQSADCKFISIIDSENDKVIVGNDSEMNIWQLGDQFWVRLFNMNLGLKEIITFSKHNNKILLTTSSNWLNEVEFKRNKIFVTRRIKLIDGSIVDYDFGDGSIAFLTSNNTIALTSPTPESVIKPIFAEKSSSSDYSQQHSSSNDDEGQLNNNLREEDFDLRKSKSEEFDSDTSYSKFQIDDFSCGNSNSLVLSFSINDEIFDLKRVKWISPKKIVAWCKHSLYLIDLNTRSIREPLSERFCKKCVQITQVFFSKSRKIMGVVLDDVKVYLLDTESELIVLKSLDFSDKVCNDNDLLLGSISPNEEMAVFSLSNFLYFINLNEKVPIPKKVKSYFEFKGTFIFWDNRGILIGSESGGALLIHNDKIESIIEKALFGQKSAKVIFSSLNSEKVKLEAIKLILPCSNQQYVVIDSSHKGILASKDVKIIATNILTFKKYSEDNFLIRLQNYNRLAVINTFNEFTASLPPCFFLSQEKKNTFLEEIKDVKNNNNYQDSDLIESISDQIFLTDKTNFSIPLRNSVQLLNEFISTQDPFNSISSKNFLKLGNLEEARNLFLKSNPNDKDYYNNMVLAAIYNTPSDSAQLIVNNFLSNDLIDEAVNVLLMTNEIFPAADILSKNGRNEDAYRVLMLNDRKKYCANSEKIILKVADSLINNKENVLFGLKLLASFGYFHEMINQLSLTIA